VSERRADRKGEERKGEGGGVGEEVEVGGGGGGVGEYGGSWLREGGVVGDGGGR